MHIHEPVEDGFETNTQRWKLDFAGRSKASEQVGRSIWHPENILIETVKQHDGKTKGWEMKTGEWEDFEDSKISPNRAKVSSTNPQFRIPFPYSIVFQKFKEQRSKSIKEDDESMNLAKTADKTSH